MALRKFLKGAQAPEDQPLTRKEEASTHGAGGHDESNWLVSYADMMTLLCGFFIMLFSMAKLDEPQYDSFKEAVSKQFGGTYESPTKDLAKFVSQILEQAGIEKNVVVASDPTGVSVSFQSTVFFDTLSSDVKPEGRIVLDRLIAAIASRQGTDLKHYKIVVEGHTDGRPITSGMYASNWELSAARSARVVRMFLDRGFEPDHLVAIGYAGTRPEVTDRKPSGEWDEEALARNRRVVIRILEPRMDVIPMPKKPDAGAGAGAGSQSGSQSGSVSVSEPARSPAAGIASAAASAPEAVAAPAQALPPARGYPPSR